MLSLDTRPRPNAQVVGRQLDKEAVLVLPDQRQVKVLNAVAARIWALTDGTRTVREIAHLIEQEYAVTPQQAEADTLAFMAQLLAKGLAEI